MSSTNSIHYQFEPLRSLSFSSIGVTYAGVGTQVSHPVRQFIVENLTDVVVTFSFDGITDHFVLPRNGLLISDVTTNKVREDGFFLAEGERLYAKGSPTTGSVYFSVMYGQV